MARALEEQWTLPASHSLSFDERVRYDEYYIRNWSLWLDLVILFRTVRVVVLGSGAY